MTIRETQFDGVLVRYDGKDAEIGYTTVPQKMRAQTILAMKTEKSRAPFTVEEHPVFDLCGPMLDVSRGGVMTVEAVCRFLDRTAALVGVTDVDSVRFQHNVISLGRQRGIRGAVTAKGASPAPYPAIHPSATSFA